MPWISSTELWRLKRGNIDAKLIDDALVSVHQSLLLINQRLNTMPTVADINAKIAALTAKVQANTDATSAVTVYVQGLKDQLTAVQKQLADAIAANDPTALQGASDALDAVIQNVDADTAAEAAIANTPAAPPT